MRMRAFVGAWTVVTGCLIGSAGPAFGQSAPFDDLVLHEARLFVNSRDARVLRDRWQENIYFPADLVLDGTRVRNVAIRSRGTGSRNPIKMGLLVDFDYYTKGQQFAGLSGLVLDNGWQDASFIREFLAMKILRRLGQPAPREAFARLYLNNEYQGIYILVEPIDAAFVTRTFKETTGTLFEYHWIQPWFTEDLGDDLGIYKAFFEPQTRTTDPDSVLYGPLRDWVAAINQPDDADWRARVDRYFDLDQFMAYVGIENTLAENDGFLGYAGVNNFYLYRRAESGQHRLIAWDRDNTFLLGTENFPILRLGLEFPLFNRAWAEPDLRARFLDSVEETIAAIAGDDWMLTEIDRVAALIRPSVYADTRKLVTNDDFETHVAFLKVFAATRASFVLPEVAGLREP
jgi:spore coat protein CotH